jgi:hypothetical protein
MAAINKDQEFLENNSQLFKTLELEFAVDDCLLLKRAQV